MGIDACTKNAGTRKTGSGVLVFLNEELGDARLRCLQLKKYLKDVLDLVEKSEQKDHIYEVAGHLLNGIPDVVFKLDKALDTAAMAASSIDYEEIKASLNPEKVDELEAAMQDVRLRRFRMADRKEPMTPKAAAKILNEVADYMAFTGSLPVESLKKLIASLEAGERTASDLYPQAAVEFKRMASSLADTENPSRKALSAALRRLLADTMPMVDAGAGEEFQKVNPKITDEEAKAITLHNLSVTHKDAKLMSRQEKILQTSRGDAQFYDELPASVQKALKAVKDQETLESDVDRWLGDNRSRTANAPIWKYTCPDSGQSFITFERVMPIKSPFTGKPIVERPVRTNLPAIAQELKVNNPTVEVV